MPGDRHIPRPWGLIAGVCAAGILIIATHATLASAVVMLMGLGNIGAWMEQRLSV
jgi:hypothetical protein